MNDAYVSSRSRPMARSPARSFDTEGFAASSRPATRPVDPERATVGRQFLDIDEFQPMAGRHGFDGKRATGMRNAHDRSYRTGFPPSIAPDGEIPSSRPRPASGGTRCPRRSRSGLGTWARTLLATMRSALRPSATILFCKLQPEELGSGLDTLRDGHLGNVGRRLDPEYGDPMGEEMLEQIAVVCWPVRRRVSPVASPAARGSWSNRALPRARPRMSSRTKNRHTPGRCVPGRHIPSIGPTGIPRRRGHGADRTAPLYRVEPRPGNSRKGGTCRGRKAPQFRPA